MFILRTVSEETEENQILGTNYSIVTKENSLDVFNHQLSTFNDPFYGNVTKDNIRGFIIGKEVIDGNVVPLFNNNHYFVMTDSGKTFARV